MNRLSTLLMILLSSLLIQGGCSVYQAYPGKKQPKLDVAILRVPWANIVVDGSPISDKYVSKVELLPGEHVIEWEYVFVNNYREVKQLEFTAQANHQYQLNQRFFPANGLYGVVGLAADIAIDTALIPLKLLIEVDEPSESADGEYYMWISELGSKQIIAGMAPNTVQGHQEITYVPMDTP